MTQVAEPGTARTDGPTPDRVSHWIGGAIVAGTSGREGPVYDPATGRHREDVDFASVEEVDAAVAAAKAAFPAWRATSLSKRTEIMFRIRNLVEAHRQELAALLTAEHGKVPSDALGEIARGLENLEFACGIPQPAQGRLQRAGLAAASTSTRSASRSASSPASRRSTSRRWSRCGCSRPPSRAATRSSSSRPRRTRRRRSSWPSCSPRPASRTACSTSSTATRSRSTRSSSTPTSRPSRSSARRRSRATSTRPARRHGKRVQALGGAKNHMIVLPDADIDMAADAAVSAGYGSAGERCMAIATIVAVGDVADPLVEAIKARLPKIKVGPGHATRPPRWGRSSRGSTATRSPRTSTAAAAQGATRRRRRPRAPAVRRSPTASSSASR